MLGQIELLLTDKAQNLVLGVTRDQRPWKVDEECHEELDEDISGVKLEELLSHERFPAQRLLVLSVVALVVRNFVRDEPVQRC